MLLEANFNITKLCIKPGKGLKPFHVGTHLRVLEMNTNMTGLRSQRYCRNSQDGFRHFRHEWFEGYRGCNTLIHPRCITVTHELQ